MRAYLTHSALLALLAAAKPQRRSVNHQDQVEHCRALRVIRIVKLANLLATVTVTVKRFVL
jgi:hypothetical protein